MHFSPQKASGFKIDEEVAEGLGLLKEYKVWKDDWDYDAFCDAFKEKYGAKPSELPNDLLMEEATWSELG